MGEHQIQSAIVSMSSQMERLCPDIALLFAIPNGGNRDAVTGARLKREGVKSGVPDMMLPVPRGGYCGLFIEVKTPKGRLSVNQQSWFAALEKVGNKCIVVRSPTEAIDAIMEYLSL